MGYNRTQTGFTNTYFFFKLLNSFEYNNWTTLCLNCILHSRGSVSIHIYFNYYIEYVQEVMFLFYVDDLFLIMEFKKNK